MSVKSARGHRKRIFFLAVSIAGAVPVLLLADMTGADPRLTGAPGDSNCTQCHTGTALNGGPGSVKIMLPNGNSYTAGTKQRIQVQVTDPSQRRWGFELSPRLASNPSNGRAGNLTSVDSNTQVYCQTRTCTATSVQFITHTQSGTRNGTTGGVTFEFDWMPPAAGSGSVTLYAAGNAANGNGQDTGDRIYTTSVTLEEVSATPKPAISPSRGVVNAASFTEGINQNSWVTISGTNLAPATRLWSGDELAGGTLPTALDGVSVTINNKPAYLEYISPTQINVLAPADTSTGQVEVRVTSNGQTSDAFIATLQTYSPAFFLFDGRYLAATHADNSLLGKPGLFASAPAATTPARPGETIVLYGTGFGPTDPPIPAGQLTDKLASITSPLSITIGGQEASVSFAGLVPPYAQLYQFNVQVPASVADGDQAVIATVGGVSSPSSAFITVQR